MRGRAKPHALANCTRMNQGSSIPENVDDLMASDQPQATWPQQPVSEPCGPANMTFVIRNC
ncbi:hypothetical protein CFBP2533_26690 [Xanthomonas hortorum pv. pelargonii]|uniref:Uncharacterized protein n=1 Tax=Xanthomonas hortorum pv. pelargonii TaxID=453602 RepID=A0A6V7DRQ5_9XANT|nr:hypothetical protein CFBP2533_26690 [Xanthomonas hortorum pv. pelargonii]CAD0339411.1 hypothetical protein CFBP2533_26690 [Xanthomonas hortorum pv. pelargonii]